MVQVSIYCHATSACRGRITLHSRSHGRARSLWLGAASFTLRAHSTGKARVRLSPLAQHLVRASHGDGLGVSVTLTSDQLGGDPPGPVASIAVHGA
jgi:hypothetical protein